MARQPFHGCDPDFIRNVCHAACCRSSVAPSGIIVAVLPQEHGELEARGAIVTDGLLGPAPGTRRCPFQHGATHLCGLHNTTAKPFGCIASPFTLNKHRTLIVRNRYRLLKCYRHPARQLPAYVAFRASLVLLFGTAEAARITGYLDDGGGDLEAQMPIEIVGWLESLDNAKGAIR